MQLESFAFHVQHLVRYTQRFSILLSRELRESPFSYTSPPQPQDNRTKSSLQIQFPRTDARARQTQPCRRTASKHFPFSPRARAHSYRKPHYMNDAHCPSESARGHSSPITLGRALGKRSLSTSASLYPGIIEKEIPGARLRHWFIHKTRACSAKECSRRRTETHRARSISNFSSALGKNKRYSLHTRARSLGKKHGGLAAAAALLAPREREREEAPKALALQPEVGGWGPASLECSSPDTTMTRSELVAVLLLLYCRAGKSSFVACII